ncbi:FDXHR family putative zinc-binding protein [Catenulispora acidiphila]
MTAAVASEALSVPQRLRRLPSSARTLALRQQHPLERNGAIGPRVLRADGPVSHPRCGASWTGSRAAHCARCCLTLSSTSAFSAHQHLTDGVLTCAAPEKVGLVPVAKPWGVLWSWPTTDHNPWSAP